MDFSQRFSPRPIWAIALLFGLTLAIESHCQQPFGQQPFGQQPGGIGQQNPGVAGNVFFGGQGNGVGNAFNPFGNGGNEGGGANADFDSLIDLIESTVESDTWAENGTGDGEIQPFPTGVYVDSGGALAFDKKNLALGSRLLTRPAPSNAEPGDVRQESKLRFVSLPRLEAAIWHRQLKQQPLGSDMLTLAGLQRVQYVIVQPETNDLILAGPAGDWQVQPSGRIVSTSTGQPVVRLDDLLTLWRRQQANNAAAFGCSIVPRQEALAATQQYLADTGKEPLKPSGRRDWLNGLQETLGEQDVEFFGIAADNHVARVLLMADYHMKLIGMGIAEGVEGVESYLSTVKLLPDGSAPSMAVLRWWFAMNYQPVQVSEDRSVYQLQGQGVKVLSENELLAAQGRRVHTGKSEALNRRFAESFTQHFEELSAVYPLYTELRNVFDLALVLSILEREGLPESVGWRGALFSSNEALKLPKLPVPETVETVVNHRVINRRHIIAGVSGGVWLDAAKTTPIEAATAEEFSAPTNSNTPEVKSNEELVWWWD